MFKEMRRKEKQMSEQETVKVIDEAEFGTLACIGDNGYPDAVPLNYAYENGAIYFHSATDGNKVKNIRANQQVCFSMVNYHKLLAAKFDTEYDSAIIYGRAYEVLDEVEKKRALMLLVEKYSSDYQESGKVYIERALERVIVFKIDIEHMTGKRGR